MKIENKKMKKLVTIILILVAEEEGEGEENIIKVLGKEMKIIKELFFKINTSHNGRICKDELLFAFSKNGIKLNENECIVKCSDNYWEVQNKGEK